MSSTILPASFDATPVQRQDVLVRHLVAAYSQPVPRYTSYPTVPLWESAGFSQSAWLTRLASAVRAAGHRVSVYVHLPYCESLCTFCSCTRRITKKHDVESPYIEAVLAEWAMLRQQLPALTIEEIHLGGGTPSFFAPEPLAHLIDGLRDGVGSPGERSGEGPGLVPGEFVGSFEGHPNNTTEAHLRVLAERGFERVSFGVQDYDPTVQEAIRRVQPYERVAEVTALARRLGYTSVNHDLIYGLPKQTAASLLRTIDQTIELSPDRIALYSYAHVPWVGRNGQRGFDDADLPSAEQKLAYAWAGHERLVAAGYEAIGMDHYARADEPLAVAARAGALHRSFMGYSTRRTPVLIGLGASSISDAGNAFSQNEHDIDAYLARVERRELPLLRGHLHTELDVEVRRHIHNLMCNGFLASDDIAANLDRQPTRRAQVSQRLEQFARDGLIEVTRDGIAVTRRGWNFVRVIGAEFDVRWHEAKATPGRELPRFSAAL